MKKSILILLVLTLSLGLLIGCKDKSSEEAKTEPIYISAAASLTDAVNEIKTMAEEELDCEIIANYGSSGALQTQIEEGAPVDIFISAGEKQVNALEEKNLIDTKSRINLLENEVVLITPKDSKLKIEKFEDILKDDIKKIAISDPTSVPVGQYSEEIFTNLNMWDEVREKMVQSQDVRQSLDWVVSGNVDCGTVYKTDALLEEGNVNIVATAPEGSHSPVLYPMAIIGDSGKKTEVEDFYNFLKSDVAKEVFEKYGFVVNN